MREEVFWRDAWQLKGSASNIYASWVKKHWNTVTLWFLSFPQVSTRPIHIPTLNTPFTSGLHNHSWFTTSNNLRYLATTLMVLKTTRGDWLCWYQEWLRDLGRKGTIEFLYTSTIFYTLLVYILGKPGGGQIRYWSLPPIVKFTFEDQGTHLVLKVEAASPRRRKTRSERPFNALRG